MRLFACLIFASLLGYLVVSPVSHVGLYELSVSWWFSLVFERSCACLIGQGHVLGLHHVASRNHLPSTDTFLRSGHSWWLSSHEWFWLPHLQNGKRHWKRCLRQVPLPRKFHPIVIFSIFLHNVYILKTNLKLLHSNKFLLILLWSLFNPRGMLGKITPRLAHYILVIS
jgi:hypothetical protein